MNQVKFSTYNSVKPSAQDYSAIVTYIINNNIMSLPTKLRDDALILNELLKLNYVNTFNMDFTSLAYSGIDLDVLVRYINKNNISNLPVVLRSSTKLLKKLIALQQYNLVYQLNFDISVYDELGMEDIADAIITYYNYYNEENINPALLNNLELLTILLKKTYYYVFNMNFNPDLYNQVSTDLLADYIVSSTPFVLGNGDFFL